MRLRTLLRPLLALVLALVLVACGDDDAPSTEALTGEADGPAVRITVDDPGWSVATPGFDPGTGDVPVQLLNERDAEVDVWVFLAPEGYEPGAAIPDGVDPVVEETLAAGADLQVTALMNGSTGAIRSRGRPPSGRRRPRHWSGTTIRGTAPWRHRSVPSGCCLTIMAERSGAFIARAIGTSVRSLSSQVERSSTPAGHTEPVLVRFPFAAALCTAALAGCSNDDAADDQNVTSDPYAVQTDDGWRVQEAVDLATDDAVATRERPPLGWYGEYVRSDYTEMIRISAHGAGLSDTRSELEQLGFEFSDVTVWGWGEGVAGDHPADESSPEVLLVSSGERTLMALSYDVPRDVLLDFMGSVEGADRDAWVDAGGVIR